MPLVLLDRDGVIVANRRVTLRTPADLEYLPGAIDAIGRLLRAGVEVALCTNQPEVARGALSHADLLGVHHALQARLSVTGAPPIDILSCTCRGKSPRLKPAGGMLREALQRHAADPAATPFVGDQLDDLRAAFHAGCRRVLVRTGLGRQTERGPLPSYLAPIEVHDDLASFVDHWLSRNLPTEPSFT